jgi:uridine kinase
VVESFAELAARVGSAPPRLGGRIRLVAVDGPSGVGKTVFAKRLAAHLGGTPIVHTDDLLDGWDDQFTFWDRLDEWVLAPLRRGEPARYRRYLWHRGRFGGAPKVVPPAAVVVVEGVSSARAAIRPELSLAVFVTAPAELRLARALDRDGAALRPYLERWRANEDRHFAADRTAAGADLVVDGAPQVSHDPARQYVRLIRKADRA